ncbi:MAG: hypothetical protein IIB75_02675 [Proteobacteria bacterium]|nr:hypothetical protein [Pseudomonadota bacterium]
MCKISVQIRDYVGLAVMFLLIVALVAGQVDSVVHEAERALLFDIHAADILQRTRNH